MLVDAHAHLDRYEELLAQALEQIRRNGIVTVAVSMDVESYLATKTLAAGSSHVRPAFGVHPWEAPRYADRLADLDAHLQETPLIGEAGLDFHFVEDASQYDAQRRVFEYQCEWAARTAKPMSLHTKGAERDVLEALRTFRIRDAIIHWYSGPRGLVDDYLALGCAFSIGPEVLCSAHIGQLAAALPDDRLLLETDNPGGHQWLTGEPGMPVLLLEVLAKVAELRRVDADALETQVADNWQRFERPAADA
ncbi:MAG TPA: TatD family hydrolase [Coriobacteriia bacterium]|nr:TatD family hydrolase [Coriobacteriia bacterium]